MRKGGVGKAALKAVAVDRALARAERAKVAAYSELLQRMDRQDKLTTVAQKLQLDKAVMGKGCKKKVLVEVDEDTGQRKVAYQWRKERKR